MNLAAYRWLVEGVVAGGPHPERHDRLTLATLHGTFDAVLSVFDEPLSKRFLASWSPRYRFMRVREGEPPGDLAGACAFIDEARRAGVATLVHCFAGLGRTGTVLGAYLLHTGAAGDADEACARVRRDYDPGAIETAAQLAALHAFARKIHR